MKKIILIFFLSPIVLNAKIYKGAELRTKENFKYGRFETRMKSSMREGMLASFFTYNDNFPNTEWNEIDIEILGRYSDDVQFNTITPGQRNHVSHFQSKFNPAKDFHTYAFEWTPDYVSWFVDGVEVYRQTGQHINQINIPQKLMMNIWNPTYPNWAGKWDENILPAFAFYDWVSYSKFTPDSGNVGTNNNFTFMWKDDFNFWDESKWDKATHTWGGNGADFVFENAVFKDGNLILCLTKENSLGFTDLTPPTVSFGKADQKGIILKFTEEIDKNSAENISNYFITNEKILKCTLQDDEQSVFVQVENYDTSRIKNILIFNVSDLFGNKLTVKNVTLVKQSSIKFPFYINCGGGNVYNFNSDSEFNFANDYGFFDGTAYQNSLNFSSEPFPLIFNSERNGVVKYKFKTQVGSFNITLHFVETYFSESKKRIFSVFVNGEEKIKDLDIYSEVGKNKPLRKNISIDNQQSEYTTIHFMQKIDNSTISGISIDKINSVNENIIPLKNQIGQNYPNPFNGETIIPIEINKPENIIISYFDIIGKKIYEQNLGYVNKGKYYAKWNGENFANQKVSSGVYFYKLNFNSTIKKIILLQ